MKPHEIAIIATFLGSLVTLTGWGLYQIGYRDGDHAGYMACRQAMQVPGPVWPEPLAWTLAEGSHESASREEVEERVTEMCRENPRARLTVEYDECGWRISRRAAMPQYEQAETNRPPCVDTR